MNPIPLYKMFPFLEGHGKIAADYSEAQVTAVTISNGKTQMDAEISLIRPVAPLQIAALEEIICAEYALKTVNITAAIRTAAKPHANGSNAGGDADSSAAPDAAAQAKNKGRQPGDSQSGTDEHRDSNAARREKRPAAAPALPAAIMGRVTKTPPKPMSEVRLEDGRVTIRGYVCAVSSRPIEKGNALILNFDITDYTNTINVSKFLFDEKAAKITDAVKEGMYLTVSGTMRLYKDELTLEPINIYITQDTAPKREDNAKEKRVELHLHTKMSATDALTDVFDVIKRAAAWGHPAIAITDHGVVHAFPDAEKAAAEAAKAKNGGKIKVIYGMEGYLNPGPAPAIDDEQPAAGDGMPEAGTKATKKPAKARLFHVIILAKNKQGLKNLYKLVTLSHIKYFKQRPVIYKDILEAHRDGLIIGSACESGEVFSAITARKEDSEILETARFYDYLEIQPLCNNNFMLAGVEPIARNEEELRDFNRKVVEAGQALDIPVVATCDAHFLDPEQEIFREIILTVKGFENSPAGLPLYFRTTDEMLEEFSYLGKETAYEVVVTNTNVIADMCDAISPLQPKGKLFMPKLEGSAAELEGIIVSRVPELYGSTPPYLVTQRVDNELKSILKLGYDVIYMAAQKLVSYLRSEGSRVGSRGSVGSSFIAYLAGITEVNPLPAHYRCPNCKKMEFAKEDGSHECGTDMPDKPCPACGAAYVKDGFNIPFETFLGLSGEKVPDIDLNISGEHSEKAQRFVYEMFGWDNVYRAGTIGKIKDKNAYGYVSKYLEEKGKSATRAEINRLCKGCIGVKQTTSQHAGGFIIIPQDMEVTDFCPVQFPSDEKKKLAGTEEKDIITTHFDYHAMEDNLIKLDMLGHDNPTMLVMLEELTGVNADDIKLDDTNTMSIFSSPARLGLPEDDEIIGKTGAIGIPEFGTVTARKMLCETKPDNFDMLVRLSGYAHGINVWFGNARELILEGRATVAQTISSRDDIMLYLISSGMEGKEAFAISESVRKGKGLPKGTEGRLLGLGIPQWYIDSCNKITYLFPRAHSVAYVMMAFRIAWFKVHRPLEYYSAHFYRRSQGGAFDALTMTNGMDGVLAEIRRVNALKEPTKRDEELMVTLESCYEFYLRGFSFAGIDLYESDAERFLPVRGEGGREMLRPPFVAVGGLGSKAALSLAENREGRRFISTEEILAACPAVNKSNIAELRRLGAIGGLPDSSQISLF